MAEGFTVSELIVVFGNNLASQSLDHLKTLYGTDLVGIEPSSEIVVVPHFRDVLGQIFGPAVEMAQGQAGGSAEGLE